MNEILKLMNELRADELDSLIMRANIILEKKRKEEAEAALREKERQRQERIAQEKKRQQEIAELLRKLQELQNQKIVIPDEPVQGNDFVMYDVRRPIDDARVASAAVKPASTQATPAQSRSAAAAPAPKQSSCPHCHALNPSGSAFCANCGQRMDGKPLAQPAPKAQPVQRSGECVRKGMAAFYRRKEHKRVQTGYSACSTGANPKDGLHHAGDEQADYHRIHWFFREERWVGRRYRG